MNATMELQALARSRRFACPCGERFTSRWRLLLHRLRWGPTP